MFKIQYSDLAIFHKTKYVLPYFPTIMLFGNLNMDVYSSQNFAVIHNSQNLEAI